MGRRETTARGGEDVITQFKDWLLHRKAAAMEVRALQERFAKESPLFVQETHPCERTYLLERMAARVEGENVDDFRLLYAKKRLLYLLKEAVEEQVVFGEMLRMEDKSVSEEYVEMFRRKDALIAKEAKRLVALLSE